MISSESLPGRRLDDARGIELGEGLVPVAARLVAGVVARTDALEDLDDLGQLGRRGLRLRVDLEQPSPVLGAGVLDRVDDRQGLLLVRDVGRLLAGRLLGAPDAQEVVVDLEGEPQGPAEPAIAGDDRLVVRREEGAGLDRAGDERRRLAPDHVEIGLDGHQLVRFARRDVDVLALAQREARLVVQAHQPQDLGIGKAEIGQPVERDSRQAEQRVAGVDGLGNAVDAPQRRPVASLEVAVLDVVVDEAEVVPELDRRRARQRLAVIARDRGVRQQAEQRTDPLAAIRAGAVEREVIADHLVQAVGRGIAVLDQPDDLAFGVGDQLGEVQLGERRGHRGASVHETCSLAVAC